MKSPTHLATMIDTIIGSRNCISLVISICGVKVKKRVQKLRGGINLTSSKAW